MSGYISGKNEAVDSLDADREVDNAAGGGYALMDDGTFATIDCTIPRYDSSMTISFVGNEGKLYMNNDGEWRYWSLEDGEHVEELLTGIEAAWMWEGDYESAFGKAASYVVDFLDREATNRFDPAPKPEIESSRSRQKYQIHVNKLEKIDY